MSRCKFELAKVNDGKGYVYARGVRRTTSSSIDISIGKSVSDRVKLWQQFLKVRGAVQAATELSGGLIADL